MIRHSSHLAPSARYVTRRAPRGLVRETVDYCSREGATRLKARIEDYWRERGHEVIVSVLEMGFHPAVRSIRYDVRSDLINGVPQSLCQTAAPELDDGEHPDRRVSACIDAGGEARENAGNHASCR